MQKFVPRVESLINKSSDRFNPRNRYRPTLPAKDADHRLRIPSPPHRHLLRHRLLPTPATAPAPARPIPRATGYYKYKAGPKFYENGEYTDRKDVFNIYALFYEKDDKVQTLDGHIATNNYEHPNMVALAIIDQADAVETEEWKRFELPFDYERFGKTIDLEKLAKGQYNISIILSASKNGDEFKGAPGSTLLIDDLEIEYK